MSLLISFDGDKTMGLIRDRGMNMAPSLVTENSDGYRAIHLDRESTCTTNIALLRVRLRNNRTRYAAGRVENRVLNATAPAR